MRIAVLSLFFVALFASAQDKPRVIDFTKPLIGIDSKPIIKDKDGKEPMTLGDAAVIALETSADDDRTQSGEEKFKRDQLARKIYNQKDVVLSIEEIALIKTRIGKILVPAVIGAAWPLLDPSTKGQ